MGIDMLIASYRMSFAAKVMAEFGCIRLADHWLGPDGEEFVFASNPREIARRMGEGHERIVLLDGLPFIPVYGGRVHGPMEYCHKVGLGFHTLTYERVSVAKKAQPEAEPFVFPDDGDF